MLRDVFATTLGSDALSDVAAVAEFGGLPITVTARVFGLAGFDLGKPRVPTTMAALVAGSSLLWANDDPHAMVERIVPTLPDSSI